MDLILERLFQALHATSVGGVAVSIVAFQAVDPGSTPGRRMYFFCVCVHVRWDAVSFALDVVEKKVVGGKVRDVKNYTCFPSCCK